MGNDKENSGIKQKEPMNLFDRQYTPRNEVDKETLKKKVFEYCCLEEYENKDYTRAYKDEDIDPDRFPAWETFKKADFDLDKFFLEDLYLLIDNDLLRNHIVVECLLMVEPISKYVMGWMDGYLDFGSIEDDNLFKYLYFCQSDEEIWDLLGFGIGNIESLFLWYLGIDPFPTYSVACNSVFQGKKDEAKAKRILDYILTESPYTTEEVRTEILEKMGADDLTVFIDGKDECIKRYEKRAEIRNVDSLWNAWRRSYLSDDSRLREDAEKCRTKAVEMAKSIFEDDDLEEEFDL